MTNVEEGEERVFDFVLVARRDAELWKQIAGLRPQAGAVVFERIRERKIAGEGRNSLGRQGRAEGIAGVKEVGQVVVAEFAVVRFDAAELVMPMPAAGEIPSGIGTEKVQGIVLVFAVIFALTNLVVDLVNGLIDPRVRAL